MQAEGGVIPFPDRVSTPVDFSVFFAEEHRKLFKALYFVTGNRADAAELMQDAFLKLWERWDSIDRIPTPEQVSALQRLDSRLADPASWLPVSAWVDPENKAYVPSRYEVCYNTAQPGIEFSRVLASFPQPAEDLLSMWDKSHNEMIDGTGVARWDTWCSDVATDEARALARILEDAGSQKNGQLLETPMFGYVVQSKDPADGTYVRVVVAPLLPHQG
jgi:hypothetical protein